jgi:hypothetical protein
MRRDHEDASAQGHEDASARDLALRCVGAGSSKRCVSAEVHECVGGIAEDASAPSRDASARDHMKMRGEIAQ